MFMLSIEKDLWFALQVIPRHERKVDAILQYQNYGHFLPMCRARRNWSDRIKIIEQPLFPGYVFVRSRSSNRGKICGIPGVVRIVSFGGRPCSVPDSQIEVLQRIGDAMRYICPAPYLAVGQKVQIVTGPLVGIIGIIGQLKKRGRLIVSVDLIMKSVAVEIDESEVAPLKPEVTALNQARMDELPLKLTA
jgi:transcription antitermination factor NusG